MRKASHGPEFCGCSSRRLYSSPSILITCQHMGGPRVTDALLPQRKRRKFGQRDGEVPVYHRQERPPSSPPPALFWRRSCSKRSKPLLLPAVLFALSAGQDPPLTSVRMASLRRTCQLSCRRCLNCVHASLQKPPRLISASIKSLWLLLRLHFLLLDHEK